MSETSNKDVKKNENSKSCNSNAGKSNNRKRRSNYKPKAKEELSVKGRDNNPNWYFLDKNIAEDVCNYSFETVLGLGQKPEVPTVATLYFNATPGNTYALEAGPSNDGAELLPATAPLAGSDGANYAAMKLYTLLSAGSGRNVQYQANDVLVAILAMSSVIEYAEYIRRAFGIVYTYNPRNRIVPKLLLQYQNINFEDFVRYVADYRTQFNYIISRINQLPIPGNIAFLQKAVEMYQRVYADDASSLSQLFQYVPATLWYLDEQSSELGSILRTMDVGLATTARGTKKAYYKAAASDDVITYMSSHLTALEDMITKLLDSTTLNLVYMDLIHLAEKKSLNFIHLDYLVDGYAVVPEVNNNALLQFHNMNLNDTDFYSCIEVTTPSMKEATCADGTKIKITPDNDVFTDVNTGRVIYNPGHNWTEVTHDIVVDFPVANPTLEDKVEANRFTSYKSNYVYSDEEIVVSILDGFPDHYCVGLYVAKDVYDGSQAMPLMYTKLANTDTVPKWRFNDALKWWSMMTKFTATPVMPVLDENGNLLSVVGDLNYWTTIPFNKIARMNQVMIAGLFDFRS